MRRFYSTLILFALLAVTGNAFIPFIAQQSDKILICTAEGYRFVSAAEAGFLPPAKPTDKHRQHCVMCVLAIQSHNLTPPLDAIAVVTPASRLFAHIIPAKQHAIPCFEGNTRAPRAPPFLS